jgi:hypothetical protein
VAAHRRSDERDRVSLGIEPESRVVRPSS